MKPMTLNEALKAAGLPQRADEAKAPKLPKDKDVPIEVEGVKGMKSKPFSKKFKNQAAMEKWMEKNGEDITVHRYSTDRVYEDVEFDSDGVEL